MIIGYDTYNTFEQINIPAKAGIQVYFFWIPCQARNVNYLNELFSTQADIHLYKIGIEQDEV